MERVEVNPKKLGEKPVIRGRGCRTRSEKLFLPREATEFLEGIDSEG
ncbi:MAG: hypothetical protein QI223_08535 [Candidatus Korarchaeota archaeon]|nr:hypothetical protein [Candidatus Korarchaeota archaeon]